MTDYSHELVDDARLSHMNTADVFKCPSCGFVGCVVEDHQNGSGFWDLDIPCDCEPRYCPNCGAVHWEIATKTVRFSHCPYCGIAIDRFIEEEDRDERS